MATRFIAKHGLKSNINRLTLSEGEIAIAYSDDKSEAEIYVGGNDNTPIPTAGTSTKTKNQIFPGVVFKKNPKVESGFGFLLQIFLDRLSFRCQLR